MFKKAAEPRSLQRLSGTDKKKLRRTVKDKFPNASDADIDALLPLKVEITVAKFPNRAHVYSVEGGCPLFFDVDGRGSEIFPTVYALWMVPDMLPAFMLKAGEVSCYVLGGADLMFPGIRVSSEGLPSFLAGQPWAVKVPGNPAPFAVGVTTMSSTEALKAGLRGKALRITHYYRDSLWEAVEDPYVPNAGFLDDIVIEDPSLCSASTSFDDPEKTMHYLEGGITDEEKETLANVSDTRVSVERSEHKENGDTNNGISMDEPVNMSTFMSTLSMRDSSLAEEENDEKDQQALSCADIDALLDKCLLQSLHKSVKDNDLPMPGSTLWSNHILPCRQAGITLDIKRSSHKKLSKWLKSKSSIGLISVKEDKYKKEIILLAVNRVHPEYTSFKPEKRASHPMDEMHESSNSQCHQAKSQLMVVEIYKPTTHVHNIFTSVGEDTGKFFSFTEASDVVFRYIEKENLVKSTDKSIVVLDAILCDALYKGTIKKGSTYPTEIHKKDLGSTFVNRMQIHHRVSRGTEVSIRKGAVKSVQIMTERRQGNKKVTRVFGVESFLMDVESLASELQKKFACSTSVADLPGKKGHYEVLVQGGVIDDLAKHLVEHYDVPKKYIEVLDKTRK